MSGVIDFIGNIIGKIVDIVVDFIGDIFNFLLAPFGTPDIPEQAAVADQQATGVTVTKQGTNVAIPVVYGFRRVGGVMVHAETGSTTNRYLWCVYALSEGQIQGVKRILVDDVELPLPSEYTGNSGGTAGGFYANGFNVNVSSDRFAGRIRFQCFDGGSGNPAVASIMDDAPIWPTKNRAMTGVAYVAVRFEWKEIKSQADSENNPFRGGIPKVQFDICGKLTYNVREMAPVGVLNLANDYADLNKTYNTNPANCILDYLMNPTYGAGIPKEQINAYSFWVAANKYDQTVTYNNTYTGKALSCNGVIDTNNKILANVKLLIGGGRGIMPYTQGRYKLKVEDGGHATDITSTVVEIAYDVDKNVVIGGITLQGERKRTKLNQAIVNYVDPDLDFTNQQVFYNVSADKTIDNDEELSKEFTFHTITNKAMAYENARMIYLKSRQQRSVKFKATRELIAVEVGDVIRITDTILQLTTVSFRVVKISLNADLTVSIDAVEHDASIYPATGGVGQLDIPPSIYNPDPISLRPRQRGAPIVPLGILPPNQDPDSSGEPEETNPLPPRAPGNFKVVNLFKAYPNVDVINVPNKFAIKDQFGIEGYGLTKLSGFHVNISSTKGLAFHNPNVIGTDKEGSVVYATKQTATSGGKTYTLNKPISNDYLFWRNSQQLVTGESSQMDVGLFLNLPTDPSFDQIRIRYFNNETEITSGITQFTGPFHFIKFGTQGFNVGQVNFVKFDWSRVFGGAREFFPDGSNLGTYTYFDPIVGRNLTGSNIEAYLNYLLQNPLTAVAGMDAGVSPAGGDSQVTTHNLGT